MIGVLKTLTDKMTAAAAVALTPVCIMVDRTLPAQLRVSTTLKISIFKRLTLL